jgi:hypothetical protein
MENSQGASDRLLVNVLRRKCLVVIGWLLVASVAAAQPVLHLNGWKPSNAHGLSDTPASKTRTPGRLHLLVQFAAQPGGEQISALADRGATALSYVPDSTLSISMREGTNLSGLGVQWTGRLQPDEKVSPTLNPLWTAGQSPVVLVEFYSDVLEGDARAIATAGGALIHDNPDLLPHHLLIEGTVDQVRQLADWDQVSYIFPASEELVQGSPVHGCAGALTEAGPVAQGVPLVGDGWSGTAHSSASLNYSFVYLTQQDPADAVESEIERAYAEWAKYVQVTFTQTTDPTAPQTLAVLFASGPHGDGYPFTGSTGVIAHTFYPYPLSPEPIAGDQHFNNDMSWKIGASVDVFSVALHETGHALGLGHSDNPADVMYPYYRIVSALSPGDIAAVQQQYAPVVSTPAPVSTTPAPAPVPEPTTPPLTLTIQPPAATTSATSIALNGTVAGGSGAVRLNWSTNQGAAGTAAGASNWTIAAIPLSAGINMITVTAQDPAGDQTSQSVPVISILPPADNPTSGTGGPPSTPAPVPAPVPSGGTDTTPPSMNILSPPMTAVATSASSIVVSGTAQDSGGVAQVTWSTSTGGTGVAAGTNNWSTGPIPLYVGMTTILIYATDTAGNQAWRSITVTRN